MTDIRSQGRRQMTRQPWTQQEDELLRELWKTQSLNDVAERMRRGTGSVYNRVQKLGLKRTEEYKAITGCGRFKPGQKTWNAGKKGWQAGGRSKATQFKRGHTSNTCRPIGAERTSKDGILYRKVADTRDKKTDWRPVHVLAWEEHNGPLPDDHIVIFLDGNRENFDPANLEAVTRAENMRRNTIARYGEEYRSAAITLGWFKRKLTKLEQDNENAQRSA